VLYKNDILQSVKAEKTPFLFENAQTPNRAKPTTAAFATATLTK
jgi:hypothetical protein